MKTFEPGFVNRKFGLVNFDENVSMFSTAIKPESVVKIRERLFRADEMRGARRIFAVNRTYGS